MSFAFDKERNVTVVTGLNGTGKTSIFYALNWVLYGRDGIPEGLVNRGAGRDEGDSRARVELEFLHDGKRYVARRTQRADSSGAEREESFTLEEHRTGGRVESVVNPTPRINVMLPADAKPYFFFDADRFRDFVTIGQQAMVLEAVRSVLKLKVLERMVQHLRDCGKEYRKSFRDIDSGHEHLFEAVENLESSIDVAEAGLTRAKEAATGRQVLLTNVQLKLGRLAEAAEDQRQEDAAARRVEFLEAHTRRKPGVGCFSDKSRWRRAPYRGRTAVSADPARARRRVRRFEPGPVRQSDTNEALLHVYLRLNGYLTSGFIVHSHTRGANLAEVDNVAVRHPYSTEPVREIPPSEFLDPPIDRVDLLICEVKRSRPGLGVNESLRLDRDAVAYVLQWAGLFSSAGLRRAIPKLHGPLQDDIPAEVARVGTSYGGVRVRALLRS